MTLEHQTCKIAISHNLLLIPQQGHGFPVIYEWDVVVNCIFVPNVGRLFFVFWGVEINAYVYDKETFYYFILVKILHNSHQYAAI